MEDYCDIVKECDILVAQPLLEKVFSCGVCNEIKTAFKNKIPVFYLDVKGRRVFQINSLKGFRSLTRKETICAFRSVTAELESKKLVERLTPSEKVGRIYRLSGRGRLVLRMVRELR